MGLRCQGTGVEHMSRQMSDDPGRESGNGLFLWCNRCMSIGAPEAIWKRSRPGGDMRQVPNVEDW